MLFLYAFYTLVSSAPAHVGGHQQPLATEDSVQTSNFIDSSIFGLSRDPPTTYNTHLIPDYGTQDLAGDDTPYIGIPTFAHLDWINCFSPKHSGEFDIGIVGAPFDLGVTYRPGARFGPSGARMGSRRLAPNMAFR